MDIVLIILGLLISIVGLAGCILPIVPGPPLSYAALLLISFVNDWQIYSPKFLIFWAIITVFVSVFDNIAPVWGAKKYGASKLGLWLSIIGLLVGLIFFPPWGMILGTFIGAFTGELLSGKESDHALKAGFGVFVGTILGIGLKIAASGMMLYYYIIKMF